MERNPAQTFFKSLQGWFRISVEEFTFRYWMDLSYSSISGWNFFCGFLILYFSAESAQYLQRKWLKCCLAEFQVSIDVSNSIDLSAEAILWLQSFIMPVQDCYIILVRRT